mgnify:CR=1 FL=1
MNRPNFIEELHIIQTLLQGLVDKTNNTLAENRRIRKLLKLPQTVHNKARITNYIKNGTK